MNRRRLAHVLGGFAVVSCLVGGVILCCSPDRQDDESEDGCVPVTMWSSDEKVPLLQDLSRRFKESGRQIDGKCVNVTVSVSSSQGTADALAADPGTPWNELAKPDIWSPASRIWVDGVRAAISGKQARVRSIPDHLPSLATSPIVIAMPEPMARELGWPEGAIGWQQMLTLAQDPKGWGSRNQPWGAFKIGKTNPVHSTTGLLATIATATALSGSGDALTTQALENQAVTNGLRGLENSAVHYGKQSAVFVRNLYAADQEGRALTYVSAVPLEEKVVLDYNKGILVGNPTITTTPPKVKLAAVFPTDGTAVSDNPALVIDADWVTDQKRRAAEEFVRYVQEQKSVVAEAGFRDSEGNPGPAHVEVNGTPTNPVFRLARIPAFDVVQGVRGLWERNRKRANVLLVVDVSASMDTEVGGTGRSRLALARDAARTVPDHLTEDDTLSLWEFSSRIGTDPQPWRERVKAGPVAVVKNEFVSDVGAMVPGGATELYESTTAAVDEMRGRFDQSRINAVVLLSDGKNEPPRPQGLTTLLDKLSATDPDNVVRVFSIAYGNEADREVLEKIAAAARGGYYDSTDASRIDQVMADVLSNF